MKIIVGLGNPGKQYEHTRHNVGFLILDKLISKFGFKKTDWKESKKTQALFVKTEINGTDVELIKPQTFMNNSGVAVAYAVKNHNLSPTDIIVIHDDKDIPLGEYKIQTDRSSAGHNGVKSIIEHLGTQNFMRVRVGVAPKNSKQIDDTAKFVLNKFGYLEKTKINQVITTVAEEITTLI